MIVSVEEIGSAGLEIDRDLSAAYLAEVLGGEGGETGLVPLGPAKLHARFEKVSGKILLTARTSVSVEGECRRCMARTRTEVPVDFQLSLVERARPSRTDGNADEGEAVSKDLEGSSATFDLASVEEEVFSGHQIDLGPLVREQILLAVPMSLLCREACKGLCPVCGKDLNEAECGCERKIADPRWAALKDIKLT